MQHTSSISSKQEDQNGQSVGIGKQEFTPGNISDRLETTIAKRAHEISQQGGEQHGHSLASWLKAAREVLSEKSECQSYNSEP